MILVVVVGGGVGVGVGVVVVGGVVVVSLKDKSDPGFQLYNVTVLWPFQARMSLA